MDFWRLQVINLRLFTIVFLICEFNLYLLSSCWCWKGVRWKTKRKLLFPAFHYEILKQFFPIINEQSRILLELLTERSKGEEYFDVSQMLTNLTLGIISGKKINKVV